MRTANIRETLLHFQVQLRVAVEGVVRDIHYFITLEIINYTLLGEAEYLSLILGIPQLYLVNALISIRQLKIIVGDTLISEAMREVVRPKLVFYKDYNLLIYPKSIIVVPINSKVVELKDNNSLDQSKSLDEDEAKALDVEEL